MKSKRFYCLLLPILIALIVGLVFSLCSFLIKFNKLDLKLFYVCYFITIGMIIYPLLICFGQCLNKKESLISSPIVVVSYIIMILQIIFAVCVEFFGAIRKFSRLTFCIIEGIIVLAAFVVLVIGIIVLGKKNSKKEAFGGIERQFKNDFLTSLEYMVSSSTIESVTKELKNLYENAKYSDPISNEKTQKIENEMLDMERLLRTRFEENDISETLEIIRKLNGKLNERNILCKQGK